MANPGRFLLDVKLQIHKTCDNCGKPFYLDRPNEAPHKRFCSAQCRNQYHYKQWKAKKTTPSTWQKEPSDADQ